jgi:hypothetical protein
MKLRMVSRSAIPVCSSVRSGQTASNLPAAFGAGGHLEYVIHTKMLQLSVGGRRKPTFGKLSGLQTRELGNSEKGVAKDIQDNSRKGVLFQTHHSRRHSEARQRSSSSLRHIKWQWQARHNRIQGPCGLNQYEQQTTGQSVRATNVNSLPLDKILRTVVNGSTAVYDRV